jgi:glycerol kinase
VLVSSARPHRQRAYSKFTQYYRKPGWVGDAEEIWRVTLRVAKLARRAGVTGRSPPSASISAKPSCGIGAARPVGRAI